MATKALNGKKDDPQLAETYCIFRMRAFYGFIFAEHRPISRIFYGAKDKTL
jgi:hypothetical protein